MFKKKVLTIVLIAIFIVSIGLVGANCKATTTTTIAAAETTKDTGIDLDREEKFILKSIKEVKQIAQLTGKESINSTDKYLVYGTDLGSMFEHKGKIYMVFGDTFGLRSKDTTGGGGDNWRSNVMAVISDEDPSDGIIFDTMITDDKGKAKELIKAKKIDNLEITVIPTGGISAKGSMYLFYMSVKKWGLPGEWTCNYAGMAKSADYGNTWIRKENIAWPGNSGFIQVSPYKIGDDIFFWAIPSGRFGGVKLMKVKEVDIEDINSYLYYIGMDGKIPQWSPDMNDAVEIIGPPVGELSVMWNEYFQRWIMTYLNEKARSIEIREGINPWGPWSKGIAVCNASDYPALYGAYMHPRFVENNGQIIYFAMSQWKPYNVFWMKAKLEK